MDDVEKLAQDHWEFIEGLVYCLPVEIDLRTAEYLYKQAFIHGYKHGEVWNTRKEIPLP